MKIDKEQKDIVRVKLPKEFDIVTSDNLRKEAYSLIELGRKEFEIDFSDCEFIDSTGLGVLIAIHKKCLEVGGLTKLRNMNSPSVKKIFQLTRLDNVFNIY